MSAAAFAYIRDAVLQTIGISCGAIAIAIVFGIPLALVIARGGFAGRAVAAAVLLVRAIPDLVLAVVAVVAVGLGPAAGLAALGVHYAAVVAKLYAEILNAVRREAAEALRATGATSTTAFLVGMLPAAWSGMVGFGAYAFESTVRASVIVGVVGAGGIGALLIQQLNLADYRGFAVSVAALVVLVVVTDAASTWLRFHARPIVVGIVFACIAGAGVAAFAFTDDPPWATIAHAPAHLAAFVVRALPPDAGARDVSTAVGGVGVSLAMAVAGTVGGTLLALPFAWLASAAARARATFGTRTPAGRAGAFASSALLALVRAVPPIALGLIGLSFLGIGPVPGVFALVLHTAGVLGKLLAESLELAERTPAQALAATGATPAAAALVALVPAAAAAMAAHTLYRLEWNVRAATTLGMIGAGGIGQAIFNAQQLLFDRQLSFYVIVAIALVLAIDAAGSSLRSRWHVRGLALA
jgi:phosphonate transport system permease protein